MKTASKVFIIIGLVCSIIILICGFAIPELGGLYIGYGIYSLITSIGSLCSVNGHSKGACIAWGVFYIPVMLLASIFMFCIPEDQLY